MPQDMLGTANLTKKLTKVLFTHIRNYLPEIVREINGLKKEMEDKLKSLGTPLPSTKAEKLQLLWNMVSQFCQSFNNTIRGRLISTFSQKDKQSISGGAKIKQYYSKLYDEYLEKGFSVTSSYSDPDIERAIK